MATMPRQSQSVFAQSLSPSTALQVGTTLNKPNVLSSRHRDDKITAMWDSVKDKLVRDPYVEFKRDFNTQEFDMEVNRTSL